MNGADILIDTNICIYLLNGDAVLAEMLQDQTIFLSVITEIELYSFHGNTTEAIKTLDAFFQSVYVIDLDSSVKTKTIEVRRDTKLKLPDSMIAASALRADIALITADKAFERVKGLDLIIYEKA